MFNMFSAPTQPAGADPIKDGSDKTFMTDVIEASRDVPVIVDFWATWCGPCKQLGPTLEKVVRAAKGAVKMVRIDTDKNPMIAQQLRVQSIPAVYAFFQGRPVDAFVGALPESQIKQWVDRLVQLGGGAGGGGAGSLEEALEQARQLLDAGDFQSAAGIYSQVLEAEPNHAAAFAGLARCLMASGDIDSAREMMGQVPEAIAKDKDVVSVRTALDLLEQGSKAAGPIPELMETVARNKDDHQARFDLAMALYAANKREAAVDELLEIVRRDRQWNDEAARKQLVKFFEAFGPTDKLTVSARRRLSSILFS